MAIKKKSVETFINGSSQTKEEKDKVRFVLTIPKKYADSIDRIIKDEVFPSRSRWIVSLIKKELGL